MILVLTKEQYKRVEDAALHGYTFRDDSGPVQAGFLAGAEHVLRILRNGFTPG